MHGKHGDPDINGVDIVFCNVHGDRSAAARVHLAELPCLPQNLLAFKCAAHKAEEGCACIGGAGFAARAGIFCDDDAAIDIR